MPIETLYADLGRRLEQLRTERSLTQEQLGQRLSIPLTRAAISNIERGRQRVLTHVLVDLARALDVPLNHLVPSEQQARRSAPDLSSIAAELPLRGAKATALVNKLRNSR